MLKRDYYYYYYWYVRSSFKFQICLILFDVNKQRKPHLGLAFFDNCLPTMTSELESISVMKSSNRFEHWMWVICAVCLILFIYLIGLGRVPGYPMFVSDRPVTRVQRRRFTNHPNRPCKLGKNESQ